MKPTLVTLHSLKGGTGKTTTAINLGCLLAEKAPTLLIDLHVENPQYKELVGGPDPTYNWFSYFNTEPLRGTFLQFISDDPVTDTERRLYTVFKTQEFQKKIKNAVVKAPETKLFRNQPCGYLHILYSQHFIEAYYNQGLANTAHSVLTSCQHEKSVQRRFLQVISNAIQGFTYVIIDSDAGGKRDRPGYPFEWQLHWYVNGYTKDSALDESDVIYGIERDKHSYVLESIESALRKKRLFKKARAVIVSNSSRIEIDGLREEDRMLGVYGKCDSRLLVVNSVDSSHKEDIEKILYGCEYKDIVCLPKLSSVGFGNIGEGNVPTVYGPKQEHANYRANLERLANSIQ